MLQKAVHFL